MVNAVGIAVFAKAPVAGFAKTRLIPLLGAERAAALQRALIQQAVEVAVDADLGPVSLWCTPDCDHEAFTTPAQTHAIELFRQAGGDLGARFVAAFGTLTPRYPLLIIGTDCPMLTPGHLTECASALRTGADAVFLPTEDGGYALVGAAKPIPSLFGDMPWSTDQVMIETRARARQNGLTIVEPAVLWDLDTPDDYRRAVAAKLIDQDKSGLI
jgi:rSAM/selenodomain-associated transferase 1